MFNATSRVYFAIVNITDIHKRRVNIKFLTFVSGSQPLTHVSTWVIISLVNSRHLRRRTILDGWCAIVSLVLRHRPRDIGDFAAMRCIPSCSTEISCHEPSEMSQSSAISPTVKMSVRTHDIVNSCHVSFNTWCKRTFWTRTVFKRSNQRVRRGGSYNFGGCLAFRVTGE